MNGERKDRYVIGGLVSFLLVALMLVFFLVF